MGGRIRIECSAVKESSCLQKRCRLIKDSTFSPECRIMLANQEQFQRPGFMIWWQAILGFYQLWDDRRGKIKLAGKGRKQRLFLEVILTHSHSLVISRNGQLLVVIQGLMKVHINIYVNMCGIKRYSWNTFQIILKGQEEDKREQRDQEQKEK